MVEEKIKWVSTKLSLESGEELALQKEAVEIAKRYLDQLPDNEERFPRDVALASLYIAWISRNPSFSLLHFARIVGRQIDGWTTLISDIERRTK